MSTLRLTRGDSAVWDFTCVDGDGAPLLLAGVQATFTVKQEPHDSMPYIVKELDDGISIVDSAGGLLRVTLSPDDTYGWPATRTYHWDLQLAYSSDSVFTIDTGLLLVNVDISRNRYAS